jgi:hypothetical protein
MEFSEKAIDLKQKIHRIEGQKSGNGNVRYLS